MVKLLDYAAPERWAELEASDNVFALVVMAQIRAKVTEDAETLKGWKFRLIRLMYERGYEQARILELFRLIDWMIRLPKALEAGFRQLARCGQVRKGDILLITDAFCCGVGVLWHYD
ncbi:hypothetical protein [Halochromatium roseum]|uniref:hypothetical protein n=1 Tax=Halochromatium roseum TaxID=391920 RepID=UPI001F5DF8CF|nr:hypothetical protein [Halochromatium roseum]